LGARRPAPGLIHDFDRGPICLPYDAERSNGQGAPLKMSRAANPASTYRRD